MKTKLYTPHPRALRALGFLACAATAALSLPTRLDAQTDRNSRESDVRTPRDQRAATQVRVTRASNFIGADVTASDGRKVGDIVDYYFDLSGSPHLEYVVVMTGGFLDIGGDRRAVPASAISTRGDSCHIDIESSEFWDVPVLPQNAGRFLDDSNNQEQIARTFNASSDRNRENQTERQSASNPQQRNLVSYGELRNADIYGANGDELGFFVDAWVSLDQERAPYFEITPTYQPFRTPFDTRYAIPTARFRGEREFYGFNVETTADDLREAESVSETDGVKMLQSGEFRDDVLRVRLAQR